MLEKVQQDFHNYFFYLILHIYRVNLFVLYDPNL